MSKEGTPTKKLMGGPILARLAGHIFVPNPRRIVWGETTWAIFGDSLHLNITMMDLIYLTL